MSASEPWLASHAVTGGQPAVHSAPRPVGLITPGSIRAKPEGAIVRQTLLRKRAPAWRRCHGQQKGFAAQRTL